MKKFFTLAITMAFLSALMPTKVWGQCYAVPNGEGQVSTKNSGTVIYTTGQITNNAGIASITFEYKKQYSRLGVSDVKLQYSNNGSTWHDIGTTYSLSDSYQSTSNISLSRAASNATYFRVITSGDDTRGEYTYNVRNFQAIYKTSLSANVSELNFGSLPTGKSASRTITLTYSNIGSIGSISHNATSPYSVNIDNSNLDDCPQGGQGTVNATITYNPTTTGEHNQTIKFTGSNGGQVSINVSGSAAAIANPQHTWSGSDTYKVGNNIDLSQVWTSNSKGSISYAIKSFTPNTAGEAGATAPSLNGSVLSLGQAGTVVLELVQNATTGFNALTSTKTITIEKYTLSASINKSTATWDETISNPFTVKDDRGENFSGYSVTALDQNIADYVNGQIVTYSTNGTAQARFTISYGETYKYNALSETLSLTVAAAAESECYVLEVTNEKSISGYSGAHKYSLPDKGKKLSIEVKKQSAGSKGFTIKGYDANNQPTTIKDIANNDLSENYKTFEETISENIVRIEISAGGTLDKYYQNLKVTRLNYLNASVTSVEAVGAPDENPSGSFSVNYGDCGSTFTVRSSNPKITVSPATFNVSAGNGTQTITFTGNTQATGKETATITVYNQSRRVEVDVTCYQQYIIHFDTGEGASKVNPLIVTYDKAYTLPANPTKTGYTFAGWQKVGEDFVKGDKYSFTDDITLTAVWTPNTYDLILDYNYENAPSNATHSGFFTYDAQYTFNEEPDENIHPVGYHFDGWYADEACKQAFSLSGTYTTDGNTTIYAKWAPNKYGLTLNYNYDGAPKNGVFFTQSDYFTYDATYNINEVPDKKDYPTGYHFDGWYSNAACTDGNRWENGTYKKTDGLVLYAKWTADTYTLTFELNGGSWNNVNVANNQTTITYNQKFGTLLNEDKIQRSGYTFKGWYSDANFTTKVVSEDIVSENPPSKLYAKWEINGLTVTFDANYPNNRQGEKYDFSSKVTIGQRYTLPTQNQNPSIAGYTFTGWKTKDNTKVEASTVCQIGDNHTLFGCWEANTFTVTYSPNQGNWSGSTQAVVKEQLTYDQEYGQDNKFPADPTRDGYTFQGWWTAEADGQQVTASTVFETAENQTLYAHWSSNNYKLIFDYKDEAGTFEAVDVTYDAKYPTVNKVPTRVGFTFVGWYDANNTQVDLSELHTRPYKTAGNERFFAHWIPNHYTVKFKTDANSDVIDSMSISVAYHDVYGILPKLKVNGQEVTTEWYDAPANGMLVTPTTIFQPANVNDNQEFILYATTNPEKFALQLVDGNQTTTIGISEGQTYADALKAAGIKKEETGKTFKGWSATQNGTPKVLSEAFSEDCQTLYALWEKTQLQVSFADGEHTNADYGVLTLAYGDTYGTGTRLNAAQTGLPSVAEVTGKTFKGWAYADNMFVNNTTPATFTTDDHTLTAVWMANNYTIYLHDAQANKTSTIDVTYGADYTLATPAAVNGYTFDGWYEDNKSTAFAHNGTYTQSADIHLYAHWTAITGITVSFDAQGGTEVSNNITATFNQAYGNLPTPTRKGYTFVGWFTAAEGGTEVTNATICKQTKDHHLFAHWTANNYTIYLHDAQANKTATIDVSYDGTYTLTNPAERTGYTFAGWFTAEGSKKYESTTYSYIWNEDLHLFAHWTAVNYMVTFSVPENANLETTSKEVTFDSQYGELPTPALEGYVFNGWFTEDGNIVTSTDICRTTTDHTLTAHWTANTYTITFDANGGECHTANKQVAYNTAIGKLPLATRPGYTFNGWWANAEHATSETDIFTGLSGMTLTADWKACEYTVTFLAEGGKIILSEGSASESNQTVTYADAYGEMPTAIRDGYSFDGWFTCDNEKVTSNSLYTIIGDQELHAHWTAEKFTVTFSVPDKATLSTPYMEVTFDSPYGELPTPTLAGYVFTGWYTTQYDGSLVSHSTIVSTAQAHTLYAHWTGADVTIHFNSNGGSEVADVTRKYQANYCEPALPTPTKEGYLFIGWYLDGTLVTNNTIVDRTEAHTLTASWAEADVPYLVVGNNWNILSEEANNDYRFKLGQDGHYHLSNIRVVAESSFQDGGTTVYQASVTIFLNGVFYGVGVEQGQSTVLQTTENGNSCLFTTNNTTWATIQSAEMKTRWFNFDLNEESSGTWRLSISCGKQGNPTEVDNNESEQPARAKKYIEDGKVFIQTKEDRIYNASGQLVK